MPGRSRIVPVEAEAIPARLDTLLQPRVRLTESKVFFKLRAKAQAQSNTSRRETRTQRSEHPGGENIYVATYALFNHGAVFIEMFGVTLPPILMSIHYNE